jgi:hypothetical protein
MKRTYGHGPLASHRAPSGRACSWRRAGPERRRTSRSVRAAASILASWVSAAFSRPRAPASSRSGRRCWHHARRVRAAVHQPFDGGRPPVPTPARARRPTPGRRGGLRRRLASWRPRARRARTAHRRHQRPTTSCPTTCFVLALAARPERESHAEGVLTFHDGRDGPAHMGVDAARCVAIEDSSNGLRAAAAARMTTIPVPNLHYSPERAALPSLPPLCRPSAT